MFFLVTNIIKFSTFQLKMKRNYCFLGNCYRGKLLNYRKCHRESAINTRLMTLHLLFVHHIAGQHKLSTYLALTTVYDNFLLFEPPVDKGAYWDLFVEAQDD